MAERRDEQGRAMIRNARLEDLGAIVAIYNAAIPGRLATADTEPVSVGARQRWFLEHSMDRFPLWVLERENRVAGWLSLSPFYARPAYSRTAEVSVYVAPEAQRRGYAMRLLEAAIRRGPEIGIDTLLGFIFGHNGPSIQLFERAGFAQWGRLAQVAVLDGLRRDVVIFGRHLP